MSNHRTSESPALSPVVAETVEEAISILGQFIVLWGETKRESRERRIAAGMVDRARDNLIAAVRQQATQELCAENHKLCDMVTDKHRALLLAHSEIQQLKAEGVKLTGEYTNSLLDKILKAEAEVETLKAQLREWHDATAYWLKTATESDIKLIDAEALLTALEADNAILKTALIEEGTFTRLAQQERDALTAENARLKARIEKGSPAR